MTVNVHKYERAARVVIGIALCSLAFWGPKNMWFLLGLVPLLTGLIGWCPPHAMLGISTCKIGSKASENASGSTEGS